MDDQTANTWIFHGVNGRFASGVFTTVEKAEEWIRTHKLTGILTKYPVNRGCYDWAVEKGYFKARKEFQSEPEFIGAFSSGSQEHHHYEDGELA